MKNCRAIQIEYCEGGIQEGGGLNPVISEIFQDTGGCVLNDHH